MRRHVASAAMAALMMGVLFWGGHFLPLWIMLLVSWSFLPAIMILALLGVHGGPDGMPGGWLLLPAMFLQWWIIFDLGLFLRDALRQDAKAVKKPSPH